MSAFLRIGKFVLIVECFLYTSYNRNDFLILCPKRIKKDTVTVNFTKRGEEVRKTSQLTEGALLLAIYNVLLLISLNIPIIGTIIVFLLPIPMIIYSSKYHWKRTIIFLLVAFILSFLLSSFAGLYHTLLFGVNGTVIGLLMQKRKTGIQLLIGGTIANLLSIVLLFVITAAFLNINIFTTMEETAEDSIKLIENSFLLLDQEAKEQAITQLRQSIKLFSYLLPSTFVIGAIFLAFITQVVARPIVKRLKLSMEPLPKFRNIRLPRSIIWYYLLILIAMYFNLQEGSFAYSAVINCFYILHLLMLIQGLSFIYFYCFQKGISKAIPIVITFLSPLLLYIIVFLGIIDLGFNLRNIVKPRR